MVLFYGKYYPHVVYTAFNWDIQICQVLLHKLSRCVILNPTYRKIWVKKTKHQTSIHWAYAESNLLLVQTVLKCDWFQVRVFVNESQLAIFMGKFSLSFMCRPDLRTKSTWTWNVSYLLTSFAKFANVITKENRELEAKIVCDGLVWTGIKLLLRCVISSSVSLTNVCFPLGQRNFSICHSLASNLKNNDISTAEDMCSTAPGYITQCCIMILRLLV